MRSSGSNWSWWWRMNLNWSRCLGRGGDVLYSVLISPPLQVQPRFWRLDGLCMCVTGFVWGGTGHLLMWCFVLLCVWQGHLCIHMTSIWLVAGAAQILGTWWVVYVRVTRLWRGHLLCDALCCHVLWCFGNMWCYMFGKVIGIWGATSKYFMILWITNYISCMLVLLIYEIYIMIYVISTMGCNLSPILQWVLWDAYTYDSQLWFVPQICM